MIELIDKYDETSKPAVIKVQPPVQALSGDWKEMNAYLTFDNCFSSFFTFIVIGESYPMKMHSIWGSPYEHYLAMTLYDGNYRSPDTLSWVRVMQFTSETENDSKQLAIELNSNVIKIKTVSADEPEVRTRIETLNSKLEREFSKYHQFIDLSNTVSITSQINLVGREVAHIKFKNIAVEFTRANAIKFTLILSKSHLLMVTKPFGEIEGLEDGHIIYSLFANGELKFSSSIALYNFATKINAVLEE